MINRDIIFRSNKKYKSKKNKTRVCKRCSKRYMTVGIKQSDYCPECCVNPHQRKNKYMLDEKGKPIGFTETEEKEKLK